MSADAFDPNRLQGQYILSRGWLKTAPVSFAYHLLEQKPGCDLCDILYVNRMITEAQAEEARAAASHVMSARGAKSDSSVELTQNTGPVESYLARRASSPQRSAQSELTSSLRSLRRDLVPGSRVEQYEILEEIARGGMGAVYRVRDSKNGRELALKVLLAPEQAAQRARFEREIETLSRLRHPSIARLFDSGQIGDLAYYTMELVEGSSLASRIARAASDETEQALPWQQVVSWMREVALALAHCHERGVIHRDIKPHNIVIDARTDRPVLIDFGLHKRDYRLANESPSSNGLTKTGELLGSPAYMSPEQFVLTHEKKVVGPPADVWSLGVTMYYALTGFLPFPSRDMLGLCLEVTKKPVPRLREVQPQVPTWLEALVSDCLRRSPYERPDMAELARRLDGEARPPARRTPWAAAGFCAVGLLALAVSALLLFSRREARVLSATTERELLRSEQVEIRGRISAPEALVQVFEKRGEGRDLAATVRADTDGQFRVRVSIKGQGEHAFLVLAEGSDEPFLVRVARDSVGPRFLFPEMKREAGVLIVGEDLRIRGRVEDEAFARLVVRGEDAPVDDRGAFSLEVEKSSGITSLVLVAYDSLGNRSREELRYRTPQPAVELAPSVPAPSLPAPSLPTGQPVVELPEGWERSQEAWSYHARALTFILQQRAKKTVTAVSEATSPLPPARAPLASPEAWRDAEAGARAAAIADVAAALAPGFERRGEVGDPPLATFVHRASGIELVLIPGGEVSLPLVGFDGSVVKSILEAQGTDRRSCLHVLEVLKFTSQGTLRYLDLGSLLGLNASATPLQIAEELRRRPQALPGVREKLTPLYTRAYARILPEELPIPPMLVGRFEVSAGEWARLIGRRSPETEEAPLVGLSLEDIEAALGSSRDGLRLPRRAEWYHACLGGQDLTLAERRSAARCVARETSATPLERGQRARKANGFGLVDTLGNVEEWCRPAWIETKADGETRLLWPSVAGGSNQNLRLFLSPKLYRFVPRNQSNPRCGLRLVVDLP